jgi:murein DD-endopeptidase MepM/ murein hydrolase activator NlpD
LPPATMTVFPVQGPCWFTDTWMAPRSGGRRHEGVDIIAKTGNLLYAVTDGTITRQFFDRPGSLGGNALRLTAADGTYFHYAHLSAFAEGIGVGSTVVAGQVIGYVGNTGSSSTPHLHFEYHPGGGAAVNPFPLVRAINGCRVTTPLPPVGGGAPSTSSTTTVAPT